MLRILLFNLLWLCSLSYATAQESTAWLLDIKGAIGVATMEYTVAGIDAAHEAPVRPKLIILRIDTPGGLDNSMRQIIKKILSSDIPIVGYVAPQGARAASAGTYILYATHIAAMAPATTLGAATPVQLGGGQSPTNPDKADPKDAAPAGNAMERKMVNDATAFIEGLADLRGRNREWATEAVRLASSLSAQDALSQQVVNLVAADIDDLLKQLEGTTVDMGEVNVTLSTTNIDVIPYKATWRNEFLSVLSNPNIAYILMLAGIYGLFFEFSNPGMGAPGILGALCLFLALYAFQLLPINYVGAGFIVLGLGLMAAEAVLPSFGIFGIGGIISFVIGSIILIDTPQPAFRIAIPIIVAVALSSAGFIFLTISMLLKNRRQKIVSGIDTLIGQIARVEAIYKQQPMVRLDGELWQVNCEEPLQVGDHVRVFSAQTDRLQLNVNKQTENRDG